MEGVVLLGPDLPSGVYVLWIEVRTPCEVSFGHFAGGRPVTLPADPYLYIGSAMGTRSASTLARGCLRRGARRRFASFGATCVVRGVEPTAARAETAAGTSTTCSTFRRPS
ncbi:MAG: hypothetical protein R3A10_05875 [Caldilineaceae bacterium]